jgi:hypothetical protein
MTTVEIDGVVYQKLETKKVISKTAERVLYKKDDRKTLSVNERTTLFKSAVSKAHKLYDLMPLSLDDEDKLDDAYNLKVLVQKTKREHCKYDMHNIFSIIIPEEDGSIQEVKDLYSDYSNITINQVARSNLWYREWMVDSYFEENLQLTYDFLQNNVSNELSMKISETYETFSAGERGGPLFFVLMMNHLLSDTKEAAVSFNERVKKFDIKTVKGENIYRVVSLLRGAVKRLQHTNKMTEDIGKTLLTVMQTSSVDSFNQQFHHLQDYDEKAAASDAEENSETESAEIDDDDLRLEIDDQLDSDLEEARGGNKKKKKKPMESNDDYDDPGDRTTKTPAELLQSKIMSTANIRKTTGDVIVEFDHDKGKFLTPRGKYSIELCKYYINAYMQIRVGRLWIT